MEEADDRLPPVQNAVAPSWEYCPRCALPVTGNPSESSPAPPAPVDISPKPERAESRGKTVGPIHPRFLRVIAGLLLVGSLGIVTANDVLVHTQLHAARAELATTRHDLFGRRADVQIAMSWVRNARVQSASADSTLQSTQSALEGGLQSAVDLLQGVQAPRGTTLTDLPRVRGVGGAFIVSPRGPGSSTASVTIVINGAVPGSRYSVASGTCPEDLSSSSALGAGSVVSFESDASGSVVFPAISTGLPDSGARLWFRLRQTTPPDTGVSLGGVLGPFTGPGHATPVPPNQPAC